MIMVAAQVEDDTNLRAQIAKQTVKPDEVFIFVDPEPAVGINARRTRIAENHKILVEAVKAAKPDLVWQLEGDVDLEPDTLERLIYDYNELTEEHGEIAYVSGVQVGRHGLYCIGAWHVADDRQSFISVDNRNEGLVMVDATGFYCLLANAEAWLSGKSSWTDEPYGPDVVWGLSIPKKKFVDMDLHIGHKTERYTIRVSDMSTCTVRFYKDVDRWRYKIL